LNSRSRGLWATLITHRFWSVLELIDSLDPWVILIYGSLKNLIFIIPLKMGFNHHRSFNFEKSLLISSFEEYQIIVFTIMWYVTVWAIKSSVHQTILCILIQSEHCQSAVFIRRNSLLIASMLIIYRKLFIFSIDLVLIFA
jgi:hypothetical protein